MGEGAGVGGPPPPSGLLGSGSPIPGWLSRRPGLIPLPSSCCSAGAAPECRQASSPCVLWVSPRPCFHRYSSRNWEVAESGAV